MAIMLNPDSFGDLLWWLEDESDKLEFAYKYEKEIISNAKKHNISVKFSFDRMWNNQESAS